MEQKSAFESFELELGNEIKSYLKETASWTYFLSILGFVGIGLMVLVGLFFGTIMGSAYGAASPYDAVGIGTGFVGGVYVVIALLYFFPVWYLFNFSRKMKTALQSKDNSVFIEAFSNLKSHYKFVGIFAIVIISIYLLIFLIGFAGALM